MSSLCAKRPAPQVLIRNRSPAKSLRSSPPPNPVFTCLPVRADSVLLIIIGANLNSLPLRLFWRAHSSGRRKSNIACYLFNESDLLSCLYLLSDCLCSFLSSSVTLLKSVTLPPLPFLPSVFAPPFHPDQILDQPAHVSRWSRPTFPPLDLETLALFLYVCDKPTLPFISDKSNPKRCFNCGLSWWLVLHARKSGGRSGLHRLFLGKVLFLIGGQNFC